MDKRFIIYSYGFIFYFPINGIIIFYWRKDLENDPLDSHYNISIKTAKNRILRYMVYILNQTMKTL